jgi:hypothetical protein
MTRVIVDDTLRARLHNLEKQIELCDVDGRTLAIVQPVGRSHGNGDPEGRPDFSEEEIAEALQQTGGRTLADIWRDLDPT